MLDATHASSMPLLWYHREEVYTEYDIELYSNLERRSTERKVFFVLC